MTPLDQAHAAMTAPAGEDAARLRFYACVADTPLLLLLDAEPEGSDLSPRVFDLEDGPVVLAFDRDERLAAFAGGVAVPYAELPGRVIAAQLAGQGIGLGLNLGVAPSSMLLPAAAVDWLAETLAEAPELAEARPESFHAPAGLPPSLLAALDAKLARAGGLAVAALLAGVRYEGGRQGHMLVFLDAASGAEAALARAVGEALTFSGIDAGELDVTFLASGDPVLARLAPVALRFDLPEPAKPPRPPEPQAPGTDPARPPRLR